MSSGARQITQIAKETIVGTTPTPFARAALPFTTNSLNAAATLEDSATILNSRLAQKGSLTEINYSGDIESELRYGAFDDLIAGVAYNAWQTDTPDVGTDTLVFGGDVRQTFSILRGYTDITENGYHVFRGCHINSMTLSIAVSQISTLTFGVIGLGRANSDAAPAGTVTTPTLTPTFSGLSVDDIQIDGVTQVGVACVTAAELTWDNSAQTQRCLGGKLSIGAIIATLANGTGSFTMAWSNNGAKLYEKQFKDETISMSIPMTDGIGNEYVLTLPKLEITGEMPSGSSEDLLEVTYEFRVVEEAPTLTRTPFV